MGLHVDEAKAALDACGWSLSELRIDTEEIGHWKGLSPSQRASLATLTRMGITPSAAKELLEATGWDVDAAVAMSGLTD
jgi:hypothetical protein